MRLVVAAKEYAAKKDVISSKCRAGIRLAVVYGIAAASVATMFPELVNAQGLTSFNTQTGTLATAEPFDMSASVIRMLGGFLFCLGLFGAGIHIYRKYCAPTGSSSKRRLKIIERMPINQKNALLLVSLDGKEILISSGPDTIQVLTPQRRNEIGIFDGDLDEACVLPKEEISCAV